MAASTPSLNRFHRHPPRASAVSVQKDAQRKVGNMQPASNDLPARFLGSDDDDDADDGTGVHVDENATFAQKSVYGMLAATQSKARFPNWAKQESDCESDVPHSRGDSQSSLEEAATQSEGGSRVPTDYSSNEKRRHRKRLSARGEKLARTSHKKPSKARTASDAQDAMAESQILPSREVSTQQSGRRVSVTPDVPVLDRKLQAMAKAESHSSSISSHSMVQPDSRGREDSTSATKSLPHVVAHIFHLEEPEELVAEYPCWYLQNVLLQGFMYITHKHICFYSYLEKKTSAVIKSGQLGKQPKHSYRYRRYWFVLRGDHLSYYGSAAEPYYPLGQVDLRYAISADLSSDTTKETADFTITTPDRIYYYQADTSTSAKEWVKQLQKVIFRSHNDGDAVKISVPVASIMDIEESNIVDFAETVKLRVVPDDQTYAVDEYFFTFFELSQEAIQTLHNVIDGSVSDHAPVAREHEGSTAKTRKPFWKGRVSISSTTLPRPVEKESGFPTLRASASPGPDSSPKLSGEFQRSDVHSFSKAKASDLDMLGRGSRRSSDASNESARPRASNSHLSPVIKASKEESVASSDDESESAMNDAADPGMSASQMLSDDGVFRGPTLRAYPPHQSQDRPGKPLATGLPGRNSRHPPLQLKEPMQGFGPHQQHKLSTQRQDGDAPSRTVTSSDSKRRSGEAPARGTLARGISMPLQHAMNIAGVVRSSSKKVGTYLSSSPKGYLDKWSDAIAGGKRHYTDVEGLAPDDSVRDLDQKGDVLEHERRFREHFGLPPTEKLLAIFYAWIHKTVPLYGKIYMGTRRFCCRSLLYGTATKMVIPYKDILNVQKQRGFRWGSFGLIMIIRGHEELFFDFKQEGLRDDCAVTILRHLESTQTLADSTLLTEAEIHDAEDAAAENEELQAARKDGNTDRDLRLPRSRDSEQVDPPSILFDDPTASVLDFKPAQSMRITCLTIGSRGDVQPYIALCQGLLQDGHRPKIATHAEFRPWVESYGIEFAEVTGDPAELMRLCVENGMFTPAFFFEVNSKFRTWLDDLLQSAWDACTDADLLIESPSAMCGIHIAEALEVPYFRAFTMPWTRTRAYPHAFAVPTKKQGGNYNVMTYAFFDNIFWRMTANQINTWRRKTLGLGPTSLDKMQQNKVPFLYNFSPSVVVPPLDFSDWIKVTGYWFLDEGTDYQPPEELAAFIQKAREDKQKLVYIGFGSVTVSDSRLLMQQIIDAVLKADVRCILAKGWSDRLEQKDPTALPMPLPSCIHQIVKAPHDWLFQQVDAVVHHGGAGTTGASLRAGVPTIIRPFFGDQFFFATRVEDLGVGMHLDKVTSHKLGRALWLATHDARMRKKAAVLGETIRSENGVRTAINAIYRELDYAKTLIKRRGQRKTADGTEDLSASDEDVSPEKSEEKWTFVGSDLSEKEVSETDLVAALSKQEEAMKR